MPAIYDNQQTGILLPTTNMWSIQQIESADLEPELKELLIRLYQNINLISLVVNQKRNGVHALDETLSGDSYFYNPTTAVIKSDFRSEYTKTFYITEALPNTTTYSFPHNIFIPSNATLTVLRGATTNDAATSSLPLPFASPTAANCISLEVTDTDIIITTGSDRTSYTRTIIVVGLLKD